MKKFHTKNSLAYLVIVLYFVVAGTIATIIS
jgi:hypothetical protein